MKQVLKQILVGLVVLQLFAAGAVNADSLPGIAPMTRSVGPYRVTWYGVTTLLFDDGETQLLIDGFFSRPKLQVTDLANNQDLLSAMAEPDVDKIVEMIESADLTRLAVIIPVHSHFDHAMDLGVIAKLTGAVVVGSESTANIARGAGVEEDNIHVITNQGAFEFGKFKISLFRTAHLPMQDGGPPIPGNIDAPLTPPVMIGAWKEGGSYTVVIQHPAGTALVQGSAGYLPGALDAINADSVFLGIGGLELVGAEHTKAYLKEIIGATSPTCVIPVHWDDFINTEFGEIVYQGNAEVVQDLVEYTHMQGIGLAAPIFGRPADPFACEAQNKI